MTPTVGNGDGAPLFTLHRAGKFLARALRLRCPHCGRSPLFPPLRQTRSLQAWFAPLDGCPRCGYPYEREIGYFLLAIWAVNYGFSALLALGLYLTLEVLADLTTAELLVAVMIPPAIFSLLFARHAKALFLAFDHFFDPAAPFRDDGDDGPRPPVEQTPSPPKPTVAARK